MHRHTGYSSSPCFAYPVQSLFKQSLNIGNSIPHILHLPTYRPYDVCSYSQHGCMGVQISKDFLFANTLFAYWVWSWIHFTYRVYWSGILLFVFILDIQEHFYQLGHVEVGSYRQVATCLCWVGIAILLFICINVHTICWHWEYHYWNRILLCYLSQHTYPSLWRPFISLPFRYLYTICYCGLLNKSNFQRVCLQDSSCDNLGCYNFFTKVQ